MKRILIAILACLLLCGCGGEAAETTPTEALPAVDPTEPSGSYDPGSGIELATGGAVRAYPQNLGNILAIERMGADLLVFSGYDTTTITRLTGENLFRVAESQLSIYLSMEAPSLYISDDRVGYFDDHTRELVYLDENLREVNRINMPEDMQGEPVLSADRTRLYYCTSDGVRVLDMDSGISRLIKEMSFAEQYMSGILMGDTVLWVDTVDKDGNYETFFLDAQTGGMVGGLPEGMRLTSGEDYFYAIDPEGIVDQMLFGTADEIFLLTPQNYLDSGVFLPENHAAVVPDPGDEGLTLDYYALETGMRTSTLALEEKDVRDFVETETGYLYFLSGSEENGHTIYRWELSATPIADETIYTGPRYTLGEPDEEGLAACRNHAAALSQRYGLEILIATDAVNMQPYDYNLVAEYQVPVIRDALNRLEEMLSQYPTGLFAKSVEGMEDGALTLCLVRNLVGSYESGSLETSDGIQFWVDNHAYVAIAMGEQFERTFYNEMFHVLEARVLSDSIAYYRWDELNPKGFDYDYDYIANQSRDGSEYLEEKSRSFIDTYSMSFPKEDRARVMEYACMPGNENYFISYTMQRKLRTLCEGIRDAYGLEDSTQVFLWEQYLESPLAPQT